MFENINKLMEEIQQLQDAHALLEEVYLSMEHNKPLSSKLIYHIAEYFQPIDEE